MSNNKKSYSTEKLNSFKNILEEKLGKMKEEVATIKSNLKEKKQRTALTNTDFNGNSKHFQQQAVDKRLMQRLQRKSRDIRAALKRIEEGTYGICNRTGELIDEERLSALPTAKFNILPPNKKGS